MGFWKGYEKGRGKMGKTEAGFVSLTKGKEKQEETPYVRLGHREMDIREKELKWEKKKAKMASPGFEAKKKIFLGNTRKVSYVQRTGALHAIKKPKPVSSR